MRQVQDHELSALLDGELDAARAEEVRALIRGDAKLLEEYQALALLDGRLSAAAEEAAFFPEIEFPTSAVSETRGWQWSVPIVGVLALIAIRFLPKVVDLSLLGFGIQLAAFAAIAVVVVRMAQDTPSAASAYAKGTW